MRYAPVLILLSLLFMGLSTVPVGSDDSGIDLKEAFVEEETRAEFSLTENYLRILGDDELLQARSFFRWPGEGTREDPIIVANQVFSGDHRRPAFRLDNTSLYLIMENCTFDDGMIVDIEIEDYLYADWDLFLRNCTNVTITGHSSRMTTYFTFLDCEDINIIRNQNGDFTFYGSMDTLTKENHNSYLRIEDGKNHTISNNLFSSYGPAISSSKELYIWGNTFIGSDQEMMTLESCEDISIFNNRFENHTLYFSGDGTFASSLKMGNNTIDGRKIELLQDRNLSGEVYSGEMGLLLALNISDLSVGILDGNTSLLGLQTWNCEDIVIINTSIEFGYNSISFTDSKDITIKGSSLSSYGTVVQIDTCANIEMSNCSVRSKYHSPYARLEGSENIRFIHNNMTGGWMGASISNCNYTLFKNNYINDFHCGISLKGTSLYNRILNNTFNYGNIMINLDGGSLSTLELGGENTIAGRSIIFLKGTFEPGLLPDGDISQLIIFDLHHHDLERLSNYSFSFGISIQYSSDLLLDSFNVSTDYGFYMQNCERIRIINSIFHGGGISIRGGGQNLIDNCTFREGYIGINIEETQDITLKDNTIADVYKACEIIDTTGIRIIGNQMLEYLGFFHIKRSSEIIFADNTIYLDQGGPIFQECVNISFERNHLRGKHLSAHFLKCQFVNVIDNWMEASSGMSMGEVNNLKISGNYISDNNYYSIHLTSVFNLYLNNNTLDGGKWGIALDRCESFTISDNTIKDQTREGILIYNASEGYIIGNEIINNQYGLIADIGSDILVTRNNFERNDEIGMKLRSGTWNYTIWGNTFDRNNGVMDVKNISRYQASDHGKNNTWFMEFGGGNRWSDWKGDDKDGDGFVDDMYLINGSAGSFDEKPLVWELEGEEVNGGVLDLSSGTWCFVMIIAFAVLVFLVGKIVREGRHDHEKIENM